ncbi:MAG TPA: hypothetical protein VNV60_02910 [Holophagaceae bacterium]|jgi:hypothetical protein|nr:hypothetical protein [Holophagaceae bacterium]
MRALFAAILMAASGLIAQGTQGDGACLVHLPPGVMGAAPVLVLFDPGGDAASALRRAAPSADADGIVLVASTAFRDYLDDAAYAKLLSELKALLARRFPASSIWAGGFSAAAASPWAGPSRSAVSSAA